jgi:predicted amidohydrolase
MEPVNDDKFVLALVQMRSTSDKSANLETISLRVKEAISRGAKLVCLPECAVSISENRVEALRNAEPWPFGAAGAPSGALNALCQIALENSVCLSVGGIQFVSPVDSSKVVNTHVMIGADGKVVEFYDKIHLFDSPMSGLCESESTQAGSELKIANLGFVKVGMAICYDLRFPRLFAELRARGADLILVPSAFTVRTGRAHWEVLLRARAIECQVAIAAAAQSGVHNKQRESYGHSLISDAWGTVLATCTDEPEAICCATVDLNGMRQLRAQMPVASHHREDIFH